MQFPATARRLPSDRIAIAIAILGSGIAVSLFYTPVPLIILLGVPFCVYFATRPYELLLVMAFLIPFNFIFKIGSVPVAMELLKVAAWIPFLLTMRDRDQFVRSRFNRWYLILGGLVLLSLVRAHDLPFALKECVRFGSNLGLVFLCLNLVDSREKMWQIFRVLAVSTFLVACYGFYQWAIQDYGAFFWIVNPRLDTSLAHYRDDFWEWRNRMISVLTSEMELGHYFNLCLPVGVALWITRGQKRLASKWLIVLVAMFAGLILTFTFGAWLSLAACCVLFAYWFPTVVRLKTIVKATAIASVVTAALAFGPLQPVLEAKATGTAIGSLAWDAATRLLGWKLALGAWWSHPLIGVGIGNFESITAADDFLLGAQSQGTSPHQAYFYLLADVGLIGTVAVLFIMLRSIRTNLAIVRSNASVKVLAWALAFAMCTNMIGWFADDSGFFGPHAGYLLWLFVGLSEALSRLDWQDSALILQPEA